MIGLANIYYRGHRAYPQSEWSLSFWKVKKVRTGVTAACQEEDGGKLKKLKYFRDHQIVWSLIKWEDL